MTKAIPHQLFQISKNLRHGYSTVSNMRWYGHQCQTLFGLFNSFFLSPPIKCISRSLLIYISRSLRFVILATPFRHFELAIADLFMSRDRDCPGSPLITDLLCDEEELQCEGHSGRKWKLPSATATEAVWDVGLFDLVDGMRFVEFYNWFDGFGMWVCLI